MWMLHSFTSASTPWSKHAHAALRTRIDSSDRPIFIFYNDTDYLYVYVPITNIQNRYLFTVIK